MKNKTIYIMIILIFSSFCFLGCTLRNYDDKDVYKAEVLEYPAIVETDYFEVKILTTNISRKTLKKQTNTSSYKIGVTIGIYTEAEGKRIYLYDGSYEQTDDIIMQIVKPDEKMEHIWRYDGTLFLDKTSMSAQRNKAPKGFYSIVTSNGDVYENMIEIV